MAELNVLECYYVLKRMTTSISSEAFEKKKKAREGKIIKKGHKQGNWT